jgi:hypothetical protein
MVQWQVQESLPGVLTPGLGFSHLLLLLARESEQLEEAPGLEALWETADQADRRRAKGQTDRPKGRQAEGQAGRRAGKSLG